MNCTRKRTKKHNSVGTTCLVRRCVLLDPHFIFGKLDFLLCLQTSRPRFDDGWMLGAVMTRSGIPPAFRAGHNRMHHGQSGVGMGSFGSPCFFVSSFKFQFVATMRSPPQRPPCVKGAGARLARLGDCCGSRLRIRISFRRKRNILLHNPSVSFADSSLYTREPWRSRASATAR